MLSLGRYARGFNVRLVQRLGVGFASGLLAACGATSEGDTRAPGGKTTEERGCDDGACSKDVAAVDTNTPETPCPKDDAVARRDITGTHLLLAAPAGTSATPGPTPAPHASIAPSPNAVSTAPIPNYCGDGLVSPIEQCDDGNTFSGDGCDSRCAVEPGYQCPGFGQPCVYILVCGDGLIGPSEVCDDGNALDGDGCNDRCNAVQVGYECTPGRPCREVCGDGILTPGEGCEDGNVTAGDGCNIACRPELGYSCFYQNDFPILAQDMGVAGASGAAEPIGPTPEAEPPLNCVATRCGDGVVAGGEACDDGNNVDGDGCRADCSLEPVCDSNASCVTVCGDALLIAGSVEECDDGNAFSGDGCDASCRMEPGFACDVVPDMWDAALPPLYAESLGHSQCSSVCGDGIAVAAEVCDDGAMNGAGYGYCSSECAAGPRCGDGVVEAMEECDSGVNSSSYYDAEAGCAPGCILPAYCGDSVVDSGFGEECDLGAEHNDGAIGGCSSTCEVVTICGDGRVQSSQGETCDDGNTTAGDGCDATCHAEVNGGPVDGPLPPIPTDDVFVPPPNPTPSVSDTPLPNPCL